jgi:hypothetical protein
VSTPTPRTRKQAIAALTGPRYHPAAHNVVALADEAVRLHQAIGAVIASHAQTVAQTHAEQRAARGASDAAGAASAAGGQ